MNRRLTDCNDDNQLSDGLAQFWSWTEERLRRHHGIRRENVGWYLKEMEWRYNHREMDLVEQARAIIVLLPKSTTQDVRLR